MRQLPLTSLLLPRPAVNPIVLTRAACYNKEDKVAPFGVKDRMAKNATANEVTVESPLVSDISTLLDKLNVSRSSNLIAVLQDAQERFGYLPREALEEISRRMVIPLSRIYGVVSFYAQFYTEPRGKHTIRCCCGTACHVKGAGRVLDTIKRTLDVEEGGSTKDLKFYLESVACLGTCFLAPVVMIDDSYYGDLTARRVTRILREFGDEND